MTQLLGGRYDRQETLNGSASPKRKERNEQASVGCIRIILKTFNSGRSQMKPPPAVGVSGQIDGRANVTVLNGESLDLLWDGSNFRTN